MIRSNDAAAMTLLEARLRRHVEVLAGIIGPRHAGRPSTIEAAIAHIERELAAGGEAVRHEAYEASTGLAVNLILERRGGRRAEEVVILGAHYDTVPMTPGADDNASAVAVLLEVAAMLRGEAMERTVRFVSFANEEPPYFNIGEMGSQHHARECRRRGEKIAGMLCLEMVGYFDDRPGSQTYPPPLDKYAAWALPSRGNFLGMVSNMWSIGLLRAAKRGFVASSAQPIIALPLPESIHDIRRSDHGPFWDEGFPALMMTDTSNFRNPHYHKATDTPETLDYKRMSEVAVGVAGAVREVAGA